jgi:SPP1 family predicted phage head-tail adaptor
MKISNLNTKVSLQSCTMISDGFGGYVTTWQSIEEIWAKIVPYKFSNKQKSNPYEKITHKITIRTQIDISNRMRILYDDLILEFDSIKPINSKFQEIYAIKR